LIIVGVAAIGLSTIHFSTEGASQAAKAQALSNENKIDDILTRAAKVVQRHLLDSEHFADKLSGASHRLSSITNLDSIDQIVLSLIADNEEMQNKTTQLSTELAFARSQIFKLQYHLAKAEELGVTDGLTNVGNRRYFQSALSDELGRSIQNPQGLCLIMADLDHFKRVNDQFGHLVGDMLLKLFAEMLNGCAGEQDKVARYGGEEFAILTPATLADAVALAERIRQKLETKHLVVGPTNRHLGTITASFGVARFRPGEAEENFVQRADAMLYKAKSAGRNRVESEPFEAAGASWSDKSDRREIRVLKVG
jgi:diguanylate cyclase